MPVWGGRNVPGRRGCLTPQAVTSKWWLLRTSTASPPGSPDRRLLPMFAVERGCGERLAGRALGQGVHQFANRGWHAVIYAVMVALEELE